MALATAARRDERRRASLRGGIGDGLMDELEDYAAFSRVETLALHVDDDNEAAISLYRRRGFVDGCEEEALCDAVAKFVASGAAGVQERPRQLLMTKALELPELKAEPEPEQPPAEECGG